MTWKRSYGHRDRSHGSIVADLRSVGIYVCDFVSAGNGIPDIQTYCNAKAVFIEVKEKGGEFSFNQIKFFSEYPGYVGFARDFREAEEVARLPTQFAFTGAEKLKLRQWTVRNEGRSLGINKFLELIGRKTTAKVKD